MVDRKQFAGEKAGLLLLIVFSAAIRIFFLLKYDNMPGIAATNVQTALRILVNPDLLLNFDGATSMLYRYAIALVMFFWGDPLLAPRVFTLLFGVFLALPYYGTLKILFDRRIAFFSSVALILYPIQALQSSVACSHAVFYFFLFSAFYYFFSFRNGQGRRTALWVSALLFNVAALLRFESWVFIPLFFFLLLPNGKKTALLFTVFCMVFPCLYLMLNLTVHHDFLYTFSAPVKMCRMVIESGGAGVADDRRLWAWLHLLWRTFEPSLVAGGLLGMALAFLLRRGSELAIFFVVLFVELTLNTSLGRLMVDERYGISLVLLLIPYAWFFADKVLAFAGGWKRLCFVLLLIFPAMTFWQATQGPPSVLSSQLFLIPPGIRDTGLWLKENVRHGETILIGDDSYSADLLLQSRIPEAKCLIVDSPPSARSAVFNHKGEFDLLTHRPRYVILASNSYLQGVLKFDLEKKKLILGKASLEVVFEQEVKDCNMRYRVYRASY